MFAKSFFNKIPMAKRDLLAQLSPVADPGGSSAVIVEKGWYDQLLLWLADEGDAPGEMAFDKLLRNGKFRHDLKAGVDYEVIAEDAFARVQELFPSAPAHKRPYVVDPVTGSPVLLLSFVTLHVRVNGERVRRDCAKGWTVGDVARQLCASVGLDAEKFCLETAKGERVDYDAACGSLHGVVRHHLHLVECGGMVKSVSYCVGAGIGMGGEAVPKSSSVMDFLQLQLMSPFPKPTGLVNLGNTCFLNAAVQCLTRIQALTAFMLSPAFDSELNVSSPKGSGGRIARAYRDLLKDVCTGSKRTRDPSKLRAAIAGKYKQFAAYDQADSHELLVALLDGLHEDFNQAQPTDVDTKNMDAWEVHLLKNRSAIQELFHGILFSSISCPECHEVETVREPFVFLSVPVHRSSKSLELMDCLRAFSKSEVLDEKNKWECPKCKQKVQATKEMGVERCPPILIIQLKRFAKHGSMGMKIDTDVAYPDILDTKLFSRSQSEGTYKLIGIVFHFGGTRGGHYVAAAFDQTQNQWYRFNDTKATAISPEAVHNKAAYILFYQRICV